MRNVNWLVIVGVIGLGVMLFGYWDGRWTERDVKKMASAAQKRAGELKHSAEEAVQAVSE